MTTVIVLIIIGILLETALVILAFRLDRRGRRGQVPVVEIEDEIGRRQAQRSSEARTAPTRSP